MAWYLNFASGRSVTFASPITAPTTSFAIEYTIDAPSMPEWGTVFQNNVGLPTTTAGSFGSQRNTTQQNMNIWFTLDGKSRVVYTFPVTFSAGAFTVRVEWDSTTNSIRLYKDGSLVNTWTNYNSFNIANLPGIAPSANFAGKLYAFTVEVDGTTYTYDPSASNGTGSTLPDTTGSNNGTLTNFPVDDSQWVYYLDPADDEYALRFDGSNDYITTASMVGGAFADRLDTAQNWELEFKFARKGASEYIHRFLRETVGTAEVLWRNSDGLFRVSVISGQMNWTLSSIAVDTPTVFKVVRIPGTASCELFVNGVSQGTRTPSSNVTIFNFNEIGRSGTTGYINGDLYYLKYTTTNSGVNGHWNPSASNGVGSLLQDVINNNDGTLVNFPVDDTQWILLSVPQTITGTSAHSATTATHSGTINLTISNQFTYTPNTGRSYVTLTGWTGDAVFPVTPVAGDQIEYPDTLTVNSTGDVTGSNGSYTLTLIQASSGTVYTIDYAIGAGAITGTASHAATTATHSATGERTVTATSTHQAVTATHASTAERTVVGTSSHTAATATVASVGKREITASSSHQANAASQTSVGERIVTATSSHSATTATHSATGEREITAASSHQASVATHSATGEREVTATSSHQATTAIHSSTGELSGQVSGVGSHQANAATHSSVGEREITSSSAHQANTATHSGSVQVGSNITGTAAHQAERATSTGVILRVITGSLSTQATTATHSSVGERTVTGSANNSASTSTHSASGQNQNGIGGTGVHQAERATSTGVGIRVIVGNSNGNSSTATHSAVSERTINGLSVHQAGRATQRNTIGDAITGNLATTRTVIITKNYTATNISPSYKVAI